MGDQNERLVSQHAPQSVFNHLFRGVVHIAGGFVQHQNIGIADQRAGKGYGLPLTTGKRHAPFAHLCAESRRVGADEVRHPRKGGSTEYHLIINTGIAKRNIIAHGSVKKDDILRQKADPTTQISLGKLADIHAAELHGPFLRLVQTNEHLAEGGFAGTHTPDHTDLFPRADTQGNVREREPLGARIGEGQILEGERGLQLAEIDILAVIPAFGGELHKDIERLQGHAGILEARDLHERRHGPAYEDVCADEPAHRHGAVRDAVHAPDHHAYRHRLRHQRGNGDGKVVVFLRYAARFGRDAHNLFPQVQHPALGHAGLERFQPVDQLHEERVFLHVLFVALLRRPFGHGLENEPGGDQDGDGAQRKDDQRPCDIGQQEQRHDQKGKVDEGQESGRTEKLAQRFEFAQVIDQRARGFRLGVQPHGEHFLHQTARKDHIGVATRHIHKVTTQVAQQEIEKIGDKNAYGEHPQRIGRIVGHHAVIDVHDEQRADDTDEVDDHAGEGHMPIDGHVVQKDIPKPTFAFDQPDTGSPVVKPGLPCGENGIAGIVFLKHPQRYRLRTFPRFGENHFRLAVLQSGQDAGAIPCQQQDAGQHQRRNVLHAFAVDDLPVQPGTLGGMQAGTGRDAPRTGQPRHEEGGGNRLPPQAQQGNQTVYKGRGKIHVSGRQAVVDQRDRLFFLLRYAGCLPLRGT